jgi:UDP-N-acetylglucosamine/UDP-N-acetylgalactosamine diphosphorylase
VSDRLAAIKATLETQGQEHLLTFHDRLPQQQQEALLDSLETIDFAQVARIVEQVRSAPAPALPDDLEPAPYYAHGQGEDSRTRGEELVREGKVAVFCVAGGQGTRLGWSGPKGTYPATAVTGKPLFRVLAEQILANQNRYRTTIPLYIMTSPLNDAATRAFFADNNCFGLSRRNIFMFPQGMLPSLDAETGRILLAAPGVVAMHPDGHGGSIRALAANGALEDMVVRGIEQVSYVQIDNPLVKAIDPLFLGLHAAAPDSSGEMSSKMVLKTDPDEKVGVFCRSGGRTIVVEYSDLPAELASQRADDGRLRFRSGSIAVHALSLAFLKKITGGDESLGLPLHAARKAVIHIDPATGRQVVPETPNAIKPETFVFDALPLARSSIVCETKRSEEFAPIKNARGDDSPETSHQLQSDRAGAWLETRGVEIPRDADGHVAACLELSPLTALEPADLARARLPQSIEPGQVLAL